MAAEYAIYRVELRLKMIGGCDREWLEDKTIDVMEALDEHTSDAVRGVAASATFSPNVLEIEINIAAESPADLHRTLAEVFQLLDDHAGLPGLEAETFTQRTRPERELACA
jgi:hypothetical protein